VLFLFYISTGRQLCQLQHRQRGAEKTGASIIITHVCSSYSTHPQGDGFANFSIDSLVEGKRACKIALQKELGLPVNPNAPLLGFIGRLDYQKVCGRVLWTGLAHKAGRGFFFVCVRDISYSRWDFYYVGLARTMYIHGVYVVIMLKNHHIYSHVWCIYTLLANLVDTVNCTFNTIRRITHEYAVWHTNPTHYTS